MVELQRFHHAHLRHSGSATHLPSISCTNRRSSAFALRRSWLCHARKFRRSLLQIGEVSRSPERRQTGQHLLDLLDGRLHLVPRRTSRLGFELSQVGALAGLFAHHHCSALGKRGNASSSETSVIGTVRRLGPFVEVDPTDFHRPRLPQPFPLKSLFFFSLWRSWK
jgi:hypothetical protein